MNRNFDEVWKVVTEKQGELVEARSYVNGRWESGKGEAFETYEPSTGQAYGFLRDCTVEQIKEACQAAKASQRVWHFDVGEQEKKAVYRRFIDLLSVSRPNLAVIRTKESGRTIEMSDADVQELIDTFDHYYDEVPKEGHGEFSRCQARDKYALTSRSPYGRGLIIYPWNFLAIWGWGVAADLTAGNAAIVKVSEETPFAASCVTELFHQALREELENERWQDLKALVQQIHGRGETTGDLLVREGDYEHLSFTGGVDTGRIVASNAGSRLKRTTLELGGHGAIIVMSDYPLDRAIVEAINASLGDAGERCVSARVAFVEHNMFEKFVEGYVSAAKALRIGNPFKIETQLNPLISRRQLESVDGFVKRALNAGLRPVLGGYPLSTDEDVRRGRGEGFNIDPEFAPGGHYYLPTVFVNVPMDAELMRKECFGPVFCINTWDNEGKESSKVRSFEKAIHLVNESEYGLSNAVLTRDVTLTMRAIERIETGILYIGRGTTGAELNKYFGGVKNSGWGRKGKGIEDSTYIKQVYIDLHPEPRMAQVGAAEELGKRYGNIRNIFEG